MEAARLEMKRYAAPMISPITWMEVMVGTVDETELPTRAFLRTFRQCPVDLPVAEAAVSIRRTHRIRLPDAIIWASARSVDALLVTRNQRDFPAEDPSVRIPYQL